MHAIICDTRATKFSTLSFNVVIFAFFSSISVFFLLTFFCSLSLSLFHSYSFFCISFHKSRATDAHAKVGGLSFPTKIFPCTSSCYPICFVCIDSCSTCSGYSGSCCSTCSARTISFANPMFACSSETSSTSIFSYPLGACASFLSFPLSLGILFGVTPVADLVSFDFFGGILFFSADVG